MRDWSTAMPSLATCCPILAAPVSGPQAVWRQIIMALCLAGLLVLLAWRLNATKLAASCVLLASSLALAS